LCYSPASFVVGAGRVDRGDVFGGSTHASTGLFQAFSAGTSAAQLTYHTDPRHAATPPGLCILIPATLPGFHRRSPVLAASGCKCERTVLDRFLPQDGDLALAGLFLLSLPAGTTDGMIVALPRAFGCTVSFFLAAIRRFWCRPAGSRRFVSSYPPSTLVGVSTATCPQSGIRSGTEIDRQWSSVQSTDGKVCWPRHARVRFGTHRPSGP